MSKTHSGFSLVKPADQHLLCARDLRINWGQCCHLEDKQMILGDGEPDRRGVLSSSAMHSRTYLFWSLTLLSVNADANIVLALGSDFQ